MKLNAPCAPPQEFVAATLRRPSEVSPKRLRSAGVSPAVLNFVATPIAPNAKSPLRQSVKTYTDMHYSLVVPGGDGFAPHPSVLRDQPRRKR